MEKQDQNKIPDIEKKGWEAEELVKEAANEESSDIVKKLREVDEEDDS